MESTLIGHYILFGCCNSSIRPTARISQSAIVQDNHNLSSVNMDRDYSVFYPSLADTEKVTIE